MKKLLAVALTLGVLTATANIQPIFAESTIATKLIQQDKKARPVHREANKGASDENLRVDFNISENFYDHNMEQENGPFKADIACKAYALDSHWLLLAGTCMDYSTEDIRTPGDHVYMERHDRKILKASAGKIALNAKHYTLNERIMLIWSNNASFTGPYVNVLGTTSPSKLFELSANHTVKIHTARLGIDSLRERDFKSNSIKGNTFKLKEKFTDLSGTATDPLFLFSKQGNEFLAAYNKGEISYALQMTVDDFTHTYDGKTSATWYSLTKEDLFFIKDTVNKIRPQDWNRIKGRLFFNGTSVPFFK
ncbi:hypothetical protein [Candidatus Avelusimicrobium sp.]|uniref:hypothetical protein n=1 Tax=Candidatus Avelusimicrobium sp. TaxID=3048833 RepID=UPI003D7C6D32